MNKKLLALVMSAVLAFSVVACGEDDVTTPAPTPTPEVTQTAEPTPTPVVEDEEKDTTGEEVGGETEDKEEVETQQPETPDVKPVHNHSFTVVHAVVDATCTEGGTVTFKCEGCNATETRPSTPYGHDYKNLGTTAATCTAAGNTTYECRRCGKTKVEEAVKALGHSYDTGIDTTPVGCETDGEKLFTCTVCNATKTEVVTKLGHNVDLATGICGNCNNKYEAKVGETYYATLADAVAAEPAATINLTMNELTLDSAANAKSIHSSGATIVGVSGGTQITISDKTLHSNNTNYKNIVFKETMSYTGYGKFTDCTFNGFTESNPLSTVTYEGCTFNKGSGRGIHFANTANKIIIKDSEINANATFGSGVKAEFTNCELNVTETTAVYRSNVIAYDKISFTDCDFTNTCTPGTPGRSYDEVVNVFLSNGFDISNVTVSGTTCIVSHGASSSTRTATTIQ